MTAPALFAQIQGQGSVSADNLNTYIQSCDNLTQLRGFTGVPGIQVFMRGYVAPGDGGQGNFYWNASGTAADDGGFTTIVPNGSATGEWTRLTFGSNSGATVVSISVFTGTGNVSLASTLDTLIVRKTVAAITTVTLPAAPVIGETHTIKDGSGNASSFNITVSGNGKNIDGAATYVLIVNYEAVTVRFDGSVWDTV